ncbi:MAG TPA: phosphoenolpyruvate carboxykinase (ATP) [Firmicutes bacterium]|nr:phosphoenolpyruvate carboxykinase (ATP) [Bacillota bacterium]
MADIYDVEAYRRFVDNLRPLLKGKNIRTVSLGDLKGPALETGRRTRFGSYGWRSAVSSRIAPKTVYLGGEEVRLPRLTDLQRNIIANAPAELHNVLHFMRTLPFVHLRRQMGNNSEYNPICNLYISVADPKNYRIAYMWGNTLREPSKDPGPEFIMIHIPEEHSLRQQVLVLPEYNINIALGTDYMGEDKKGFLRQAMWCADERGMLGLHAGTKVVTVRGADGRLRRFGVLMFGLTATGKSTWSCHQLGLDYTAGEGTEVSQDDIVFLKSDGSALGSEDKGFFVKTDVDKRYQEALYNALVDKTALFENVMIDADGNVDFLDETLCANGRAVIQRDKLWIKVGRKRRTISAKTINLPSLDELDGLIFAFITRRNTIMSFAQRLTPEQGVLAYLWGESTHSFASQPHRAGESVRIVGTDPFIIGSRGRKVNRFYRIVMELVERYPGKVHFYQYNTGGIGEIIREVEEGGVKRKQVVRKALRVPIDLMAAIQRGDLRGTNSYQPGMFGTEEIARVEGKPIDRQFDPRNFYSQEEIEGYLRDIIEGRMRFTEEVADEGLDREIVEIAERSFEILPKSKERVHVSRPEQKSSDRTRSEKPPDEPSPVERFWQPSTRLPSPGRWRRR